MSLMTAYQNKNPIYIKNFLNIQFDWENFIDLLDIHISSNLEFHVKENFGWILSHGFFDSKIRFGAEKINLYGLDKNKIYSAHVYASMTKHSFGSGYHNDDCDVFYLQTKGKSTWFIDEFGSYEMNEGDLIYCPKFINHEVTISEKRIGVSYAIK